MSENNEILVIKHDSRELIMREHVGEFGSEEAGIKGTLSNAMNRAPIIEFENGDKVFFSWNYLINKAYEALKDHDEMDERKKYLQELGKGNLKGKRVPANSTQ